MHPLILTELTLFSQVQFADMCGWPGLAGVITIFRNLLDIVPVSLKPEPALLFTNIWSGLKF